MPLRCINTRGEDIFSFQLDEDTWSALQVENKSCHHLRMQCCDANVVLKKSKLGTRFFAHAKRGECSTAPESSEHLLAKQHIVEAIQETGWAALPEQCGKSPIGDNWIADVMAQKDNKKIAFEVQWSPQTNEETIRRQNRYKESSVRGLWLLRHLQLPVSKDLPAFRLRFDKENNCFDVLIPSLYYYFSNQRDRDTDYYWQQIIPLKEFISGAITGKLKFAPTLGMTLPIDIYSAPCLCWKCKKEINVIISIKFKPSTLLKNHPDFSTRIYDFDTPMGMSILSNVLHTKKLADSKIGSIKHRYGKIVGHKYLSNGCFHCDALQGQFFEHDLHYAEKFSFSSEIIMSETLVDLLEEEKGSIFCWWFNGEK